jgi:hypothetical protein
MKALLSTLSTIILLGLSLSAYAVPASLAVLNWDKPTQREDGASLSATQISAYEIHYQGDNNQSGVFAVSSGDIRSYSLSSLSPGTYTISMLTVDSGGVKGNLSSGIVVVIDAETALPPPEEDVSALSWQQPSSRENGSALTVSELSAYELRYVAESSSLTTTLTVSPLATSYSLQGMAPDTYTFSIAAIDNDGLKSSFSEQLVVVIAEPLEPAPGDPVEEPIGGNR